MLALIRAPQPELPAGFENSLAAMKDVRRRPSLARCRGCSGSSVSIAICSSPR